MDPAIEAPDRLDALIERVIRGAKRLLLDPGLAPHNRVRLEIDLRFLTGLDVDRTRQTTTALSAYLPRILDVVETVSPFYLRLHSDLTALLELAQAAGHEATPDETPRLYPLPPPDPEAVGPDASTGAAASPDSGAPIGGFTAPGRRRAADTGRLVAPALSPWPRYRFHLAVGLLGVLIPLLALAARALAVASPWPAVGAVMALAVAAAGAGILTRATVYPAEIPTSVRRRVDPPPDLLAGRLHQTARSTFSSRSETVGD